MRSVNLKQCERKRPWSISVQYHCTCMVGLMNTTKTSVSQCPGRDQNRAHFTSTNESHYRLSQLGRFQLQRLDRRQWKLRRSEVSLRALLSRHSTGGTEGNCAGSQSGYLVAQQSLETASSGTQAYRYQFNAGVRCLIRQSYTALEHNRLSFRETGT